MNNIQNIKDRMFARLIRRGVSSEAQSVRGIYHCRLYRKGQLIWTDTIKNLVVTVGKNLELDTLLAGSGYTVTGPYLGLISSVSYSAIAAADTMASHAGWTEAGPTNAPNYNENRDTMTFNAASGGVKDTSADGVYTFNQAGTVKGAFVVLGTGAVNTKDSTAGTLYSAGLFSGGDRAVVSTDVLNVDWQVTLT